MLSRILFVGEDDDYYELFSYTVKKINPRAEIINVASPSHIEEFLKLFLPEIIFLYGMPKADGIECLKRIRRNKEYNNVPVVIYSVHNDQIAELFKNGANAFIENPFSVNSLNKVIETTLAKDWKNEANMKRHEVFLEKGDI